MKRLLLLSFLLLSLPLFAQGTQSLPADDPSLPGNAPKLAASIIACADGSHWYGTRFQAIPGLSYLVETSDDLSTWQATRVIYGFGQEETILMKAASVAVPETGSTPAPTDPGTMVYAILRRAIGGGCVLSWCSAGSEQESTWHFPELTPNTALSQLLFYVKTFDGFSFHLMCPDGEAAPPSANPAVSGTDAAMLAVFSARFDQINDEASTSVATNLAAPPMPPASNDRRFWRIQADWSHDTDDDGTPDWLELKNLLAGNPLANPYNGDVNADGIRDSAQQDSDGDSIPDDLDASKEDKLIDWQKTDPFRYALFHVDAPQNESGLGIDDMGSVYFGPHYWRAGQVNAYARPEISGARVIEINGQGNLLGITADPPLDAMGLPTVPLTMYWWRQANETPLPLETGPYYGRPNGFMSNLTEAGRFIIDTDSEGGEEESGSRIWSIDPLTSAMNVGALTNALRLHEPDYLWRTAENGELAVRGFGAGEEVVPGGWAHHLTLMPSGTPIFSGGGGSTRIRKDGAWHTFTKFSNAVDIAGEVACMYAPDGTVWHNGRKLPFSDWAPGAPSGWGKSTYTPSDVSPKGFLYLSRKAASSPFEPGSPSAPAVNYAGIPMYVLNRDRLPGVDDVSLTAEKITQSTLGSSGWMDRVWIMAPAGAEMAKGTQAIFEIPNMGEVYAQLKPTTGRVTLDDPGEFFTGGAHAVKLIATNGKSEDTGIQLQLRAEASAAITSQNAPIGVKIMKKRTVKVTVHPMVLRKPGKPDKAPTLIAFDSETSRTATEKDLDEYLNGIYGPQVNMYFKVNVLEPTYADYDKGGVEGAGDGIVIGGRKTVGTEMDLATPNPKSPSSAANIDIWVLGGVKIYVGSSRGEVRLSGFTLPGSSPDTSSSLIIMDGNFEGFTMGGSEMSQGDKIQSFKRTTAHEIGHVMIGPGHPNRGDGSSGYSGPAPLDGTDRTRRLMSQAEHGLQLVKAEWDRIENWLKEQEDQGYLPK